MPEITRTYVIGAHSKLPAATFGRFAKATEENPEPAELPALRVLEFHPPQGSDETFVGSGIVKIVVEASDPFLAGLTFDQEYTLTIAPKANDPKG